MTAPKLGKQWVLFPQVPQCSPRQNQWNMEVKGKQAYCFLGSQSKCFVIPPNYKIESKTAQSHLLHANRQTSKQNVPQCQGAQPNHVQVKSSRCCFPMVSFVRTLMLLLKTYPRWIMGPSGPIGSPAPTAHTHEKNLTNIVLKLKICRTTVPFRKPMSSGIPEPPAEGR